MALNIKNLLPLDHPKQTPKGEKITLAFGKDEGGLDTATDDRHHGKKKYKFVKIDNLTKINIIN